MTEVPVLELRDLRTYYRVSRKGSWGKQDLKAVDGVSFAIPSGTTLGLVGESGCGKSTLSKTVLGIERPTGGEIRINGKTVFGGTTRVLHFDRRVLQAVFQDPYSSLDPRFSVHEIVAEPMRINHCYNPAKVVRLLQAVGISEMSSQRKPDAFSGGQRQRIAIARALALDPDIVVLDEAVSALDVSIQAQILNLLNKLKSELGLAYLFISHDLSVVRHISDQVAVMYLGRIVEIGPRDAVFDRPAHPYTRALLSAAPVPDPFRRASRQRIILTGDIPNPMNPPSGCVFRTRCPVARPECSASRPELTPVPATAGAAPGIGAHACACPYAAG